MNDLKPGEIKVLKNVEIMLQQLISHKDKNNDPNHLWCMKRDKIYRETYMEYSK